MLSMRLSKVELDSDAPTSSDTESNLAGGSELSLESDQDEDRGRYRARKKRRLCLQGGLIELSLGG